MRPLIGRTILVIEAIGICLVLAACGSSDEPEPVGATPIATPTATAEATATPTPTATAPATVTPTPTAAATETATPNTGGVEAPAGGGAGDEEGIGVPVAVRVTGERILVTPGIVPAFLPLEMTVTSELDRAIDIAVIQAAGDGIPVGRGRVPAGGSITIAVEGLQPGSGEILSPDLNPDRTAFFEVQRDG